MTNTPYLDDEDESAQEGDFCAVDELEVEVEMENEIRDDDTVVWYPLGPSD